jgi:hypothetical protein
LSKNWTIKLSAMIQHLLPSLKPSISKKYQYLSA